ncbi:MAG: response regulator [Acidimicrobiia bacterium]
MPIKVLLIEDDPEQVLLYSAVFHAAGYEVEVANDAVVAMTITRRFRPDLIVLDLGLPGGGGFEVLRRVRSMAHTIATPVLVLTASADRRDEAVAAGANAFLPKTCGHAQLLDVIEELTTDGIRAEPSGGGSDRALRAAALEALHQLTQPVGRRSRASSSPSSGDADA